MSRAVWVLTKEYNDYDQYGEYFVAVFSRKPSKDLLISAGVHEGSVDNVLSGGGRLGVEDAWFYLREEVLL
jgi:hypothetical protein